MKVLIEINCDNSAFQERGELHRIFDQLKEVVINKEYGLSKGQYYGLDCVAIFDINGNKVGELRIEE